MRKIEVMVDIETHDTAPTAVILSIGAAAMDMINLEVIDTFYVNVDPADCLRLGLTQSPATLEWWDKQSDDAKARLLAPEPKPLRHALVDFLNWRSSKHCALAYWGNGANFDNVILANAHKAAEVQGWDFWRDRCHRTMKTLYASQCKNIERKGTHHNAVDDAVFQAEQLLAILKAQRN